VTSLLAIPTVARRELAAHFHAPIAYAVGALFLVVQGFSFWAVLEVLSDPAQRAPHGAVLENHFGGTFLHWVMLFLLVSVISMRLVAEEKRQGTWEALLTTPLTEGAVIVGKWLGAFGFYLLLWVPTLLYLVVLRGYLPPGASLDSGPIVSSYLGVAAGGGAFLAVGVAASTATSNQIIAAVATFVLLIGLLLLGELRELAPSWLADMPALATAIERVDLRSQMLSLARGEVASGTLVFHAAVVVGALTLAIAFAAWGRRRRSEVQGRLLAALLVILICALVCVLAWRHPATWDLSRSRVNTLDERTERVLETVAEPVELLVIRPGHESFEPVYREVDRLLERMIAAQPLLHRRDLDPALEAERTRLLAAEFAIEIEDLIDGGAVVLQVGDRRRAVDILDMASFDRDDLGVGAMSSFRAEQALAAALLELVDADRPVLCATSGHGELELAGPVERGGPGWAAIAARLERDGVRVEDVGRVPVVPPYCRVLIVAGPLEPLGANEALAVAEFLRAGGGLFVAARVEPVGREAGGPPIRLPATGLELVLGEYGVSLPAAVALDPSAALEMPMTWRTLDGYGDHIVTAGFRGRRATVWQRPRVVGWAPVEPSAEGARVNGEVLVATSAAGWGEATLATLFSGPVADPADIQGPASIAVAAWSGDSGPRLVVLGSSLSLSSDFVGRGLGANDAFAAAAIGWLSRRVRTMDIGDKSPEHLRLLMTRSQLKGAFVTVVLAIPILFGLLGAAVWRVRRRG